MRHKIKIMSVFNVPTKEEVSANNQAIFDNLNNALGFVPNLYATYAHSDTALENYLNFANSKTSLSAKEKEVVNLAVSQVNECLYCLSAHTAIGKMNGFTDEQILEIRVGEASFDEKLDALAKFTSAIVTNKGKVSEEIKTSFFNAGYTEANLIDVVIVVGDKIITNYIHNLTGLEIDFPLADKI